MAQRIATRALQSRLLSSAAPSSQAAAKPTQLAEVKVGQASNGVKVASQENNSPLSRVVCAVKAGSRYEDHTQRGVTHCLRAIADHTQKQVRAFRLVRELHQMGGNVSCTSSRDHLVYTMEIPRNHVETALPYLAGMVVGQSFRPWEIGDRMPRVEYELLALSEQPEKRVVERVHEAAYRDSGLGRSIYAPMFQIGQFSPDLLREYTNKYFTTDRISLSATGVDHTSLMAAAANFDNQSSSSASNSPAKYFSGEVRESSEDMLAYSVLVGEGASATGADMWAYAALEQLLGGAGQIKWASNTTTNRLNAALTQKTQDPYSVQSFNVNYSDSGLFGVSAVTVPENSEVVLKTVVEQLQQLASKPVDASDLQGAKNRVKTTVAFQEECVSDAAVSRAIELLTKGSVADLTSTMSAIDQVSAADVQQAAKKLLAGKLSMASIGEIHNVPYVDHL